MSASIWVEHEGMPCGCTLDSPHLVDGFTRNLTPMLQATGSGFTYWGDLIGKKCSEVSAMLRATADELARDPDKYRQFDSPNGWGTYGDPDDEYSVPAILARAADVAERHPDYVLGGSV